VTEDLCPLDRRVGRSGAAMGPSDKVTGRPTIDYGHHGDSANLSPTPSYGDVRR
jgi:hypothetical protein